MKSRAGTLRSIERIEELRRGFAALAGLFLGLALLKFGNPALLDHLVARPTAYWEFVLQPWPLAWGYGCLALLALAGLVVADWRVPRPRWVALLPAAWLVWQGIASVGTHDSKLTVLTLPYLAATTACFYLGMFALAPCRRMTVFWTALLGCFGAVLVSGFQQYFGGLEAVRQHVYSQPGWQQLPADYLKRLAANRIFATLFYPNALAGAVLLFLPPLALAAHRLAAPWSRALQWLAPISISAAGVACLYWSKSKAGWLIAVVLIGICMARLPMPRRLRLALASGACVLALAAFAWRFAGYFAGGAASAGARLQYWRAAWSTATAHPLLGTGPGSFATSYRGIKPPEAEMAMLAHNDYLQQASDSGFPGALLFAGFVVVSLGVLARGTRGDARRFATWLGVLGWALQSGVEFPLYVPAVGWGAFWLLGWLWGTQPEAAGGLHTSQRSGAAANPVANPVDSPPIAA